MEHSRHARGQPTDIARLAHRSRRSADNHGEIVFSFAEDDVEITRIPVAIPKGTPENNVARRIRKEFRRVLSKDDYGVDLDGGERVLISARGHSKRFEFRLVRNSVGGTVISAARDIPSMRRALILKAVAESVNSEVLRLPSTSPFAVASRLR